MSVFCSVILVLGRAACPRSHGRHAYKLSSLLAGWLREDLEQTSPRIASAGPTPLYGRPLIPRTFARRHGGFYVTVFEAGGQESRRIRGVSGWSPPESGGAMLYNRYEGADSGRPLNVETCSL